MKKEQIRREILRFLTVKPMDLPWREWIRFLPVLILFNSIQLFIIYYLGMRLPFEMFLIFLVIYISILAISGHIAEKAYGNN